MNKDFDYNQVPKVYLYCLNAQCPHAKECLRYLVSPFVKKTQATIEIVNPQFIAAQKGKCPYLHYDRLTRFASGITNLYDDLPYKKGVAIRKILYRDFGRSMYYRFLHKQRLIRPEEQEYIRLMRNSPCLPHPHGQPKYQAATIQN